MQISVFHCISIYLIRWPPFLQQSKEEEGEEEDEMIFPIIYTTIVVYFSLDVPSSEHATFRFSLSVRESRAIEKSSTALLVLLSLSPLLLLLFLSMVSVV